MLEKLITLLIKLDIKIHKYTHSQWTVGNGYIVSVRKRNIENK